MASFFRWVKNTIVSTSNSYTKLTRGNLCTQVSILVSYSVNNRWSVWLVGINKHFNITTTVYQSRPQVGQIGPKSDKSGTFSEQTSVHFGLLSKNVLKSDLKKYQICPIWNQSDPLWVQIWHSCIRDVHDGQIDVDLT